MNVEENQKLKILEQKMNNNEQIIRIYTELLLSSYGELLLSNMNEEDVNEFNAKLDEYVKKIANIDNLEFYMMGDYCEEE